jgi:predicted ATPase
MNLLYKIEDLKKLCVIKTINLKPLTENDICNFVREILKSKSRLIVFFSKFLFKNSKLGNQFYIIRLLKQLLDNKFIYKNKKNKWKIKDNFSELDLNSSEITFNINNI